MAEYLGDCLPSHLTNFFKEKTMTGIVSTVDADGYPRGAPMSLFYAINDKIILLAAQNQSQTYKNVQKRGKIALTFVGDGDVAFSLQAEGLILKEKMESSKHMGILLLVCKSVKSNVAVDVEVQEGIKLKLRSPEWESFVEKLLEELRSFNYDKVKNLIK
ncbi:hypothetical protein SYNTR_0860 [Candidatus Syntrophocurvum alkaliphilum]|uniref:Pyridoxamine 5'-phosphate oxidase N-terminal domain-containing protein n=1 Tax=Candidatus Syntrophocurvum alkaliphilum TaxID=2293317 RepID=A0A6I6DGI5_9FIRM|nr:pyridoxamine 5'-phosphate oxidase family protein [Candidatus Syntrophocurvum alkaliphilum]QGT99453.1 hypothetical protein SYNTR_0860 [Candidatus Syntrophocurvum alkaliphilum]